MGIYAEMKIYLIARVLNEAHNLPRFFSQYDFVDKFLISDSGSTDGTLEILRGHPRVEVREYPHRLSVTKHGKTWTYTKETTQWNYLHNWLAEYNDVDWVILDDIDSVPNKHLRANARELIANSPLPQINVFRLYMWGTDKYFPHLNRNLDLKYTSLWAWMPGVIKIRSDESRAFHTITGISNNPYRILPPNCLLHYSWSPETIKDKLDFYHAIGLKMNNPGDMVSYGKVAELPEWAVL